MVVKILATTPPGHTGAPAILQFAGGRPTWLIWENRVGGMSALVEEHSGGIVIKWQPAHRGASLAAEAQRLLWLQGRHPVPNLVEHRVLDGAELPVTKALQALTAVDPVGRLRGDEATRSVAERLLRLHALDPSDCPIDRTAGARIESALGQGKSLTCQLRAPPPVDRLGRLPR